MMIQDDIPEVLLLNQHNILKIFTQINFLI